MVSTAQNRPQSNHVQIAFPKVEGHIEICSECAAYVDSYRTTVALARACEEVDALPDDVPDDLVKAILTAREQG